MFTPPPSPLPVPAIVITDEDENEMDPFADSFGKECASEDEYVDRKARDDRALTTIQNHERKQEHARRLRWSILLVPAILILVGLSSHRIAGFKYDYLTELALESPEVITSDNSSIVHDPALQRRDLHAHHLRADSSASSTSASTVGTSDAASASLIASSTSSIAQTSQTVPAVPDDSNPASVPTPFPQPFDTTGSSSNVSTATCSNFFTNMTQSDSFRECRAFSLLSQFSEEFIEDQTNLTELNAVIWGTCNTDLSVDTCESNMAWFASDIQTACKTELSEDNSMVTETLLGLESYSLMRDAACLVNQQANAYCYVFAAHNSNPYDLYLYSLPMGIGMPSSTTPSCSTCASSILDLYADAIQSGNSSADGLKDTYEDTAQAASTSCGNGFATIGLESGTLQPVKLSTYGAWWQWILPSLAFWLGWLTS